MKLTGQCKIDFEEWYQDYIYTQRKDYTKYFYQKILNKFYRMIPSMQYGVLVDFFDSVGIRCTTSWEDGIGMFNWWVEHIKNYSGKEITRQEAREQAILKANEIYNERNTTRDA